MGPVVHDDSVPYMYLSDTRSETLNYEQDISKLSSESESEQLTCYFRN